MPAPIRYAKRPTHGDLNVMNCGQPVRPTDLRSTWIRRWRHALAAVACSTVTMLTPMMSSAAVVTHDLMNVGGNTWTAAFSITNDGAPPDFGSFTIYFDWTRASNLSLLASPATWDTIVIQPDAGVPADGFLDALVLDPADALTAGQSLGGFEIAFDWAGASAPLGFDFTINDANYNVVFSGVTQSEITPNSVPEPSTVLLGLTGLLAFRIRKAGTGETR